MDLEQLIQQMAANAERVRALAQGISEEQARWRPDADSWSLLEVVNHLYDEERRDFRVRLDLTLHHPGAPWPPIDPTGWVAAHRYNERSLEPSLNDFVSERQASLAWLRSLTNPDWEAAEEAPFGPIRAGDILAAWVAHDLLHIRQLVELHWAYTALQVAPYRTLYAGEW